MVTLRVATIEDIPMIQQLAQIIWWAAYAEILSSEQIAYMLETMYSGESLRKQIEEHQFLLCYDEREAVGFASYSHSGQNIYKLHKIYILPDQQGKGIGKFIITSIIEAVQLHGAVALELNVNRRNPARTFYEGLGFAVIREEDIDIGNGYWMNDFVMRKEIAG